MTPVDIPRISSSSGAAVVVAGAGLAGVGAGVVVAGTVFTIIYK